ncbi:glycosyltransferase [Streptomyces sp. NPDC005805]|uniref:glycosyltransferase n=1 Tax=Streptomyces sp. NPDC005805 TaxID=3157068 RepID=UPI0033D2E109
MSALAWTAAGSLAAWCWLLLCQGFFWRTDQRLPPRRRDPEHWPAVVVVVPARDEAEVLPLSLPSLLGQEYPGRAEVVLVDDNSTDGTAAEARAIAARCGGLPLTVTTPGEPEPGWTGKLWALRHGMALAEERGPEFLLLTDADIAHDPDSLRELVASAVCGAAGRAGHMSAPHLSGAHMSTEHMSGAPMSDAHMSDAPTSSASMSAPHTSSGPVSDAHMSGVPMSDAHVSDASTDPSGPGAAPGDPDPGSGAVTGTGTTPVGTPGFDAVSLMARLRVAGGWERLVIPAFVYFFAQLYPFRRVNSPASRTAAAAGGCVLLRTDAARRAGVPASIRQAVIDDVTLARAVSDTGGRIWLGLADRVHSVRPYPRLRDLWRMVSRSAYTQLRHSPVLLAGTVAGLLLVYVVPPVALVAGLVSGDAAAAWAGGLAWAVMSGTFLPVLRYYGLSPLTAPALPFTAVLYLLMTVDSAIRHHRGRGAAWKGRTYARPEAAPGRR